MNDLAPIFRRVAAINPVPDESELSARTVAATALLGAIDERTRTVQTQQTQQTQTKPQKGWNQRRTGAFVALAAFAVVIAIGSVVAFMGARTDDAPSATASQAATVSDETILARDVLPMAMANAMEDLIRTDSLLTVDRGAYDSSIPERLDIVLYANPREQDGNQLEFLSRVIGLPGETIEAREGRVYVNDRVLDEPYMKNPEIPMLPFGPITLGADEVWLMGDNRQNALMDSRFLGPRAISVLRGEVTGIANP